MTMKPAFLFALAIASTATLVPVQAQTYQWKDSNGRTVVSDTPPPASTRQARTLPGANDNAKASEAPQSMAERNMEFKKRQQEAKERADKESRESMASAEKKDSCERARRQLLALESGQRISNTDEKGERRFMDDAERQREIERTRKFIGESCQ